MDKKRNSVLSSAPVSLQPRGSAFTERKRQEEEMRKAREEKKNNSIFNKKSTSQEPTQSTFKSGSATMGSLSERESIARNQEKERQSRIKERNKSDRKNKIEVETNRLTEEQKANNQIPTTSLNNIKARVSASMNELGADVNNAKNKMENSSNPIAKIPYLNTFQNTLQNSMMPDVKPLTQQIEELNNKENKNLLDKINLKTAQMAQESNEKRKQREFEMYNNILNDPNASEKKKNDAQKTLDNMKRAESETPKSAKQLMNEQYAKDSEGHIGNSKFGNKVAEIGGSLVGGFMPIPGMGNTTFNNIGREGAKLGGMYAGKGIANPKASKLVENFTKNALEGGMGSIAQGMMNNSDPNQILKDMAFDSILGGALGGGLESYFDIKRMKAPNTNANTYGARSQAYDDAYKNAMDNPQDFKQYTPSERERLTRMSAMEQALGESSKYKTTAERPRTLDAEERLNQTRNNFDRAKNFETMDKMRREAIDQQPLSLPMGSEEAFMKNPDNADYINELNNRTQEMKQRKEWSTPGARTDLNIDEFYKGRSMPNPNAIPGASSPIPQENIDFWNEYNAEQDLYNQRQQELRNRWGNDESQWNDLEYLYNEGLRESQNQLNNRPLSLPPASQQTLDNEMYQRRALEMQQQAQDFEANKQRFAQDMQNRTPDSRFMLPEASQDTLRAEARQRMNDELSQRPLMLNEPSEATIYEERARKMYEEAQAQAQVQAEKDRMYSQQLQQDSRKRMLDMFNMAEGRVNGRINQMSSGYDADQMQIDRAKEMFPGIEKQIDEYLAKRRGRKPTRENVAKQLGYDYQGMYDMSTKELGQRPSMADLDLRNQIAREMGYDIQGMEKALRQNGGDYSEPIGPKLAKSYFQNEDEPVVARKEIVKPRDYTPTQDNVRLAPKQPNPIEDLPNPSGRRDIPYKEENPVRVMNQSPIKDKPIRWDEEGASTPYASPYNSQGAEPWSSPVDFSNAQPWSTPYQTPYQSMNPNALPGAKTDLPSDFYKDFPNPSENNTQNVDRTSQFTQDNVRIDRRPKQAPGFEPRFGEAPPRSRSGFEPRFSDGNTPSRASTQRASTGRNATVGARASGGTERTSTNMGTSSEPIYQNGTSKRKVNPRKYGETKFASETAGKNPEISKDVINKLKKSNLKYDKLSNKDTIDRALSEIKGDIYKSADEIMRKYKANLDGEGKLEGFANSVKSMRKGTNITALDNTKAQLLALQLDRNGDYDKASELIDLISRNATSQGQAIQALSMFSRMSPEGALRFFDKQYKNITGNKNNTIPKDLRKMVDDRILKIQDIEDDNIRAEEFAKIMRDFKDKTPKPKGKEIGDALQSWNMISMLGNPKTMLRNVLGNKVMGTVDTISEQTFGRAVDKAMSLKTGKKTISGYSRKDRKESLKIAKENAKQKSKWIDQRIDPTNLNMKAQGGTFKNKPMQKIETWVNKGLNVPDEKSVSYAYEMSLRNQMRAAGVKEATPEMMDIATKEAMEKTYKDDNMISNLGVGLQQAFDKATGNIKLGSKIVPFAKTPSNVLKRGLEYTPLGIAEGLYKGVKGAEQRDVARLMGRGLTGTAMLAPGMYLANKGLLQGELGGDTQEQNYRREMGEKANSFKLPTENGTVNMDISPLAPAVTPLLTGANIQENIKQGMGTGEATAKAIGASTFGALKEMPFVQGLNDFLGLVNGDKSLGEVAGGMLSQSIPTLSGQVARLVDPTQADTSNDPNPVTARLKAKIPGLSNTVEDRVNFLTGEEKQNSVLENPLMKALDIFLNPFNMSIQDNPKAEQYYNRVKEQGLDSKNLPNRLKNKVTGTKEYPGDINLRGEDYKNYNQQYGKEINSLMNSYYNDPEAFQKGLETFTKGQKGKELQYYKTNSGKNSKKQYKKGDIKQEYVQDIEGFINKIRREMQNR